MPSTRAQTAAAVGLAMKPVGKPDAGNPHVRFDERGRETEQLPLRLKPPRPSSTLQVTGRKRHILTDTLGLLLAVHVHPASVQDRDGAEALLREARRSFPFIERVI